MTMTVCGSDCRGDNAFHCADGNVVWLDWQLAHTGVPGYELAHTVYQTFEVESAAAVEDGIRSVYYPAIVDAVGGRIPNFESLYTIDDCIEDYKIGMIIYVSKTVVTFD